MSAVRGFLPPGIDPFPHFGLHHCCSVSLSLSADLMPVADSSVFAFFSSSLNRALDEHTATLSGVFPPSLLIRDDKQGKQSFPGSIVRLRDGSTLVILSSVGGADHAHRCRCSRSSDARGHQQCHLDARAARA